MKDKFGFDVECYETMKRFFEDFYKRHYRKKITYSVVCKYYDNSIWSGWRKTGNPLMDDAFEYVIDKKEAKNFTKETYDRALNEIYKVIKQKKVNEKLEELENEFKR
ncbi:MAG: hypothetical protein J6T10_01955 [Methanobrevibacter sp.]|nr:hypothetical protein [Methanobrevibacter sp.]